jgi:hypothetical protein
MLWNIVRACERAFVCMFQTGRFNIVTQSIIQPLLRLSCDQVIRESRLFCDRKVLRRQGCVFIAFYLLFLDETDRLAPFFVARAAFVLPWTNFSSPNSLVGVFVIWPPVPTFPIITTQLTHIVYLTCFCLWQFQSDLEYLIISPTLPRD